MLRETLLLFLKLITNTLCGIVPTTMAASDIRVQMSVLGLKASLLRTDPHPVPAEDIAKFHKLLDAAISECSPTNVQV